MRDPDDILGELLEHRRGLRELRDELRRGGAAEAAERLQTAIDDLEEPIRKVQSMTVE